MRCRATRRLVVRWAMRTQSSRPVPVASRVNRFSYAIRNIVAEAKAVEAARQGCAVSQYRRSGRVRLPDPAITSSRPPSRAMRDGHNGYLPSAGILAAREAVAAEYTSRGVAVSPDRVLITTGTSEGIELALNALVDEGDEVLVPSPTYPLYTAVLAKIGAQPRYYPTDPTATGCRIWTACAALVTERTRVLVVIDPNNPTGAVYPPAVRRALIELAERHDLTILADEVYGDLGFDGPVPLLGTPRSRRADHLVFESLQGVSGSGLADGVAGRRGDAAAERRARGHEEARRRAAVQPGADAARVAAAIMGDRSHQVDVPRGAGRTRPHHDVDAERHSRHARASRLARPSTRCRPCRCLPDGPTKTTCWRCCAKQDPLRLRLRVRHARPKRAISASSSLRTRRSSPAYMPDIGAFTRAYIERG